MRRLLVLAALLPALAFAEMAPPPGKFDPRVRIVAYNPQDLVTITTYYGVETPIRFADDEVIEKKSLSAGDRSAWSISSTEKGNILFVRPVAAKADTNMTIVTNKRVYLFLLNVLPMPAKHISQRQMTRSMRLTLSLTFTYPDDDKTRAAFVLAQAQAKKTLNGAKVRLAGAKTGSENFDYWLSGADDISPTNVRDDGRFIYLTFSRNRDLPSVYIAAADGTESLVNTSMDGNTVVVERMAPRLVLRRGDAVVCVVNRSFNPDAGIDNVTGTISPDVRRVVKGEP